MNERIKALIKPTGRPKGKTKQPISITIDKKLLNKLKGYCKDKNTITSKVVEDSIINFLNKI